MPKITKRMVEAIKPDSTGRDVFVWDSKLSGFGVRMKSSGKASYFIQYRNARSRSGRTRRLKIGDLSTLKPEKAREIATAKLGEVAKGEDPSAERRMLRDALTVAELCDLYVSEAAHRVKASTLAMDRSRIETHVKPRLGRRSVRSLTLDDIEQLQTDIATGKTAKPSRKQGRGGVAKGGRSVAARTVGMLGTILEFARRRKLIAENPARGVVRLPDRKRTRSLSLEEIGALGSAMREAAEAGENPTALSAIRLLALTGMRRMEALALPRAWVDARASCIRFEDSKSGPQIRPIGAAAVTLMEALPAREGCPWVFPGIVGDGHLVGLPRVLARLCARAGLKGVTLHTLRHSFGAAAAEVGYSELIIAGLLGHRIASVTSRYARVPDSALVAAANAVAARIAAALDGDETSAKVVPLPKRA